MIVSMQAIDRVPAPELHLREYLIDLVNVTGTVSARVYQIAQA